ncbi:MAG: hypothetical protein KDA61_03715 [Planctomycetales bacterium]|nr:hypothetical protein [Planctomycetales bacterium]
MSEPVRAYVTRQQLMRLSFIALITCGFSAYCFYDGLVGYPNQRVRALKYQELAEKEDGKLDEWYAWCAEHGCSSANPGEPKTEADIQMQFVMGAITALIGVPVLINILRTLGRSMEGTPDRLKASWGHEFDYSQVKQIDKRKWDRKGIARITYQQDGVDKKFVLDDYVFDRPATDQMLYWMEQKAGVDKIVNGTPEQSPEQAAQDKAAKEREKTAKA